MPSDTSTEHFARANGIELCYQTFGDANAPALVLIMGLGAQMILWPDDFCRQIASAGFRVIRFDNRDIGRSSKINLPVQVDFVKLIEKQMKGEKIDAPYTLRTMADDVAGLLDALGIERAHIVGASMGGMIAQELAVHHPQRVSSLTSVMSSTGNPGLPGPTPEAAAVLMAPPPKSREDYIAQFGKAWTILRAGSFPEDEAGDTAMAERLFARGLNPLGVARQLLAIFASGNRRAGLAAIKAPTLVIHGDVDPLVRPEGGADTAAAIPGARLHIVKRMGHAFPTELWLEVIGAIVNHARSAESRA